MCIIAIDNMVLGYQKMVMHYCLKNCVHDWRLPGVTITTYRLLCQFSAEFRHNAENFLPGLTSMILFW